MRAIIYLIIATILLGLNFHLARTILKEVNFIEAGFWRFLFGTATLIVLGFNKLPTFNSIRKNIKGIALPGFVGLFGFNIFFFLGLMHTTAVNAAIIVSLNPALTLVFSYLILKTSIGKKQLLGIAVSFFGVSYLILKGNLANLFELQTNIGDLIILLANVFFALHHVWVKKYEGNFSSINYSLLIVLCCLIGFSFLLPINGMENVITHSTQFWLAAVGIGCLGTATAYYLWQKGVVMMGADKAGIYMNIIPLSTALFAAVFGEVLHAYHLIGGVLIVIGLLISRSGSRTVKS